MRFIKLGLISAVILYMLLWMFTLLVPNQNVVSRAINMPGIKDSVKQKILTVNNWSPWFNPKDSINFITIEQKIVNPANDSIPFILKQKNINNLNGTMAFYKLENVDSTALQLYFTFKTPWYKPWLKFSSIVNDKVFGGLLEQTLERMKAP